MCIKHTKHFIPHEITNTSLLQKQANSMLLEMLHASQIQIQNKQKTKNVKYYLLFYIDNAFLEMYPTYRAASLT